MGDDRGIFGQDGQDEQDSQDGRGVGFYWDGAMSKMAGCVALRATGIGWMGWGTMVLIARVLRGGSALGEMGLRLMARAGSQRLIARNETLLAELKEAVMEANERADAALGPMG